MRAWDLFVCPNAKGDSWNSMPQALEPSWLEGKKSVHAACARTRAHRLACASVRRLSVSALIRSLCGGLSWTWYCTASGALYCPRQSRTTGHEGFAECPGRCLYAEHQLQMYMIKVNLL